MRTSILTASLSLCMALGAASAQQPPTSSSTFSSEAGRVAATESVKASAVVTAVDKAKRTLTLKAADGTATEIVAGPEVRNFDQIAVNDRVVVEYVQALTLQLRKGSGRKSEGTMTTDTARTNAGDKPGAAIGGQATLIADVTDVDEKAKTISLRGPKGRVVKLDVKNPDHFKVVKKGDQVEANYAEALAVAVVPAPK